LNALQPGHHRDSLDKAVFGKYYLYSTYPVSIPEAGLRTATFTAAIPAVGKPVGFKNVHTYTTVREGAYRKPLFKADGRNNLWFPDYLAWPAVPDTQAVLFSVVRNPDDTAAHPGSPVVAFTGSQTLDGVPVTLITIFIKTISLAVFLSKGGGYDFYSGVRSSVDDVWQIVLTRFDKNNAFSSVSTWVEPSLFDEEPADPALRPFGDYYLHVLHWQVQGLRGCFYGVALKLRFIGAALAADCRFEFALAANKRSLSAPETETLRFPDAVAFAPASGPAGSASYGGKHDHGLAHISNIIEYGNRLFVTLAVWEYAAVPADYTTGDIARMPDFNGSYKYHTVVYNAATGAVTATYHDTGIGEWADTGQGLYGLTVGAVEFAAVGADKVSVGWHVTVFRCLFNRNVDANRLIPAPVQSRGYAGPQTMEVAFTPGGHGCWYTANKWSKSHSTHLMQKYS
jgi:hypothetical protein